MSQFTTDVGKDSIWKVNSLTLRTGKVSPNNLHLNAFTKDKKLNLFSFY